MVKNRVYGRVYVECDAAKVEYRIEVVYAQVNKLLLGCHRGPNAEHAVRQEQQQNKKHHNDEQDDDLLLVGGAGRVGL